MAVAIVATVGSASANSYVTLAAATTALEGRSNASAWTTATDDVKNRALVDAQVELQVRRWKGTRTDATQALEWPRESVPNPDAPADADLGASGVPEYADDEIPARITQAQIELAFQFVVAGTTDLAMPSALEGIVRKKVDVLETEYAEYGRPSRGLARFPRVQALIAPLLSASGTGLNVVRA